MPAPKRQKPQNLVIETIIQEEALQPPVVETFFESIVVSPPDPRIRPLGTLPTKEYNYADYEGEVSISVFDTENQT